MNNPNFQLLAKAMLCQVRLLGGYDRAYVASTKSKCVHIFGTRGHEQGLVARYKKKKKKCIIAFDKFLVTCIGWAKCVRSILAMCCLG